jgi:hypothetical protein
MKQNHGINKRLRKLHKREIKLEGKLIKVNEQNAEIQFELTRK